MRACVRACVRVCVCICVCSRDEVYIIVIEYEIGLNVLLQMNKDF